MEQQPRTVRTSCRGCHGVCQVLVDVNTQGRVTRVIQDPDSPTSKGYICAKAQFAPELLYHSDRITRPLRRAGARGAGQWKAVSWDEALSEIAERFDCIRRESGPEYVALCQGTGRPYTEFTGRFIHAFGSPNYVGPGHNCFLPRNIASALTVGWLPIADIYGNGGQMPASVLMIGLNSPTTGASDGMCGGMVARALLGAKEVIVVDPRRTATARSAGRHLQIRPGTDCALVLAMLNVIVGEKLYDHNFVENYCTGFGELASHLLPFTPEWAEPITRLRAADIREAARAFAQTRPGVVLWGNGIDTSVNSFQTARALLILMAVTGNLDVPGGMVRWVPPAELRCKSPQEDRRVTGFQFLSAEQKAKMLGGGRFPFAPGSHQPSFWEACVSGMPYRPRAIWLVGTNPMLTATRGDIVEKALREHVEFTVVSDFFLTPAAELADFVLPAAHWLEQDDVVYFHKIWCVLARRKVAQIGEVRDDRAVMLELAHRLGLNEAFPWSDWDAYLRWILEPSGLTFDQFAEKNILFGKMRYRKHEQEGFPTPSHKIELVSSVMAKAGRPPLPVYVEPPLSSVSRPDLAKDFPLILLTGCKQTPFFHSEGRHLPSLRRLQPEPRVDVHPATAAALGFVADQRAFVVTPAGRAKFVIHLDEDMQADVIHAEHAWWFPEKPGPDHGWRESCANLLFGHEHFDPDSGAEPLKCGIARLEPA